MSQTKAVLERPQIRPKPQTQPSVGLLEDTLLPPQVGREVVVGAMFQDGGAHVHLWLIHVDIWQKPPQYCKVISLQLK